MAEIFLNSIPTEGKYLVQVSKQDFEDIEYEIFVDILGNRTQSLIPILEVEEEKEDDTILTITVVILIVILVILLVPLVIRLRSARKKEVPAVEETHEPETGLKCPKCGSMIMEDEKVCTACGEEFEEEFFRCPECGTETDLDAKSCEFCKTTFDT
jgi:DNA-directed RNA polymerase subunit M/transcription elongation factor TFIIS